MTTIPAAPLPFPLEGSLTRESLAFVVIDMQVDFVGKDGFMDLNGADIALLSATIAPIARLLEAAREAGIAVIHTRETFRPDLSDAQPHRLHRASADSIVVGDKGPLGRALVHGEPSWQIVPELAPLLGEAVFDKPSYGAFATTGIEDHLRAHGLTKLVIAGVTTDCCIHSNVREALDRGFEVLVVSDACAAANHAVHDAAMALLSRPAGVFGTLATAADVEAAFQGLKG